MQLDGSDTDTDDYNDDDYEMAREDEEKSDIDIDEDDDDDVEEEFEFRSSAPLRVYERGRLLYPKDGRGGRIPPKYTVEPRLGQDVSKTTKAVSLLRVCGLSPVNVDVVGLTMSCSVFFFFLGLSLLPPHLDIISIPCFDSSVSLIVDSPPPIALDPPP